MGYLFDALTGKIGHLNSINQPIDNGIASRIRELAEAGKPDESGEVLLITFSFGITQEVVSDLFYPNNGIFRKVLASITKEGLESIYKTIMDLSLFQITQLPLNIKKEILINNFAKVSESTPTEKEADIKDYEKAESSVMKAYRVICKHLDISEDAQSAMLFNSSFMKAFEKAIAELGKIIYNK